MNVTRIDIHNVLGIEDLTIEPGQLTVIEGQNGAGKTSVLEAIKAAIGGGHDATLVRNGAGQGRVVLVLEDNTVIARTINRSGSETQFIDKDGVERSRPVSRLAALFDKVAFNPVQFLTARPADRVKALLEAMPLVVSDEQLRTALGEQSVVAPQGHALEVIESLRKEIYDDRTGANRLAKEKNAAIAQIKSALPHLEESLEDLGQQLEDAKKELETVMAQRQDELVDNTEYKHIQLDAIRDEENAALERLRQQYEARQAEIHAKANESRDGVCAKVEANAAAIEARFSDLIAVRKLETWRLDERVLAAREADNALSTLKVMEEEAKAAQQDSERASSQIAGLDQLKNDLLSDMPVAGLRVVEGDLYLDETPFDRLNYAKRVEIALAVARLRASSSQLPLVIVDGMEALDPATFAEFERQISGSNLQVIATRVSDGPLTVRTT